MKKSKVVLAVTLVFALGIGVIFAPVVGNAQATNPQATIQTNTNMNNTQGLGLGLGKYFAGSMRDTVASTLGITVDELYSLRQSGKSIAQIGEDNGISSDELVSTLTDAKTEQVEKLYDDDVITEDQKDYILGQMESRMETNINRTDVGKRGFGKGNKGQSQGKGQASGGNYFLNNNN